MSLSLLAKRPIKSHSNEKIVQVDPLLSTPFLIVWLENETTGDTTQKNSRNTIAVAAAVHKDQ